MPMHQYVTLAETYFIQQAPAGLPRPSILRSLAASCRSFTRLVLRLREQAEAETNARSAPGTVQPVSRPSTAQSRRTSVHTPSSRRSSTAPSADSHASLPSQADHPSTPAAAGGRTRRFASPLFRMHHAPLLRLFVPSPNGPWLADESVLECEKELHRAGVLHLVRPGDVVWDTAVVDDMNAGRLVWDGNYLIVRLPVLHARDVLTCVLMQDLDYNYSPTGELPRYLHSLAFPPSYFHKVIRTSGNPLCQIDISPWGTEIANNLQLVQDRVVTDT